MTFCSLIRAGGANVLYMLAFSIIIIQVPRVTRACVASNISFLLPRRSSTAASMPYFAPAWHKHLQSPLYAVREGYRMSQEGYARP